MLGMGTNICLVTDSDERGLDILAAGSQEPVEVFKREDYALIISEAPPWQSWSEGLGYRE